jgi:quinol monooxygenase YgiN
MNMSDATNNTSEVCLVSRWKLKAGMDDQLLATLQKLAAEVEASQSGTLMYRINLPAPYPLGSHFDPLSPAPPPIPLTAQTEVVFIEAYADAQAFAVHVKSQAFNDFLTSTQDYFEQDPKRPGWPVTDTQVLSFQTGFQR